MSIKKIIAFVSASAMAAVICTGVPAAIGGELLPAVTAEAADGDFVIETDYAGERYVAEYRGSGGDITIPDNVSYIGETAFTGNKTITSVTFPESCYVQYGAFAECTSLKKVTFERDAAIGQMAFLLCIKLEEVTVNGSVKDYIMEGAFEDCRSLKKVTISENEYEFGIYDGAFEGCVSLRSINIPSKCTEICPLAFMNCFSLSEITVPENTELYPLCCGYAVFYKSEEDFIKDAEADRTDYSLAAVADGKTKCYYYAWESSLAYNAAEYTPKQLTVTVTEGSSGEKYCKENGIKYKYSGSTDEPESPENPTTPENPENPTTPENPEDSTTPENPENPTMPETPNTPAPIIYNVGFTGSYIGSGVTVTGAGTAGAVMTVKVPVGYEAAVVSGGNVIARIGEGTGNFIMPSGNVSVNVTSYMADLSTGFANSYIYSYDRDMNHIKTNSVRGRMMAREGVITVKLGREYAGRSVALYKGRRSSSVKVDEAVLDGSGNAEFTVKSGKVFTLIVE